MRCLLREIIFKELYLYGENPQKIAKKGHLQALKNWNNLYQFEMNFITWKRGGKKKKPKKRGHRELLVEKTREKNKKLKRDKESLNEVWRVE